MRTHAIVAVAVGLACGPMYQQPGGAPPADPSASPATAGPPGGDVDPPPAEVPAPAPSPPPPVEMSAPKDAKLPAAAQTFLAEHNRYRARHCAPPLTWSPKLAGIAQAWANQLEAKGCMFGHSGNNKVGENLAAGTTGAVPPEEVVRMWYDEVKLYDFKKPTGFSMETGHFTQVVWLSTTQVGCGMVQCKGNDIVVCNYDPPGNWEGRFKQQVLPASCKK